MAEKFERSKDYWSTKTITGEWFFVERYDTLWSGCEGQGAELIKVGPGPSNSRTMLLCDHNEETEHRIRVVWIEPVPGDVPYTVGVYNAWKRLGITDVVAREAWIDKTALRSASSIPTVTDEIIVKLTIDWENKKVETRVL